MVLNLLEITDFYKVFSNIFFFTSHVNITKIIMIILYYNYISRYNKTYTFIIISCQDVLRLPRTPVMSVADHQEAAERRPQVKNH